MSGCVWFRMASDDREGVHLEHALLHQIVDRIPSMLAYWDSEQRCRFANRACERWFGVSPESLIGKHISELLGPLYKLNLPYIEGALRGEPQEFEREIPDPAGGPARHSKANYLPDIADGVVRGFFVLVSDVSDIKRAQLALQESEAKFSGIIAISPEAIISIDRDQRITMFNRGAEEIFGYEQAEVVGRPLDLLLPAALRNRHRQHVAAFAAASKAARLMGERLPVFGLRKSGEEFPAEATISKLELASGLMLTVALRDITERKALETEQKVLAEAGPVLASSLDYEDTLKSIARLIVAHLADWCVVDMLEEDGRVQRLTVAHVDPAKAAFCEQLAALRLDSRHVLARQALETRQPQLYEDLTPEFIESMARDPEHLHLLRLLAPRSAAVVPMVSTGGVLGALVLVSSRPGRYKVRDLVLAAELARRAALAVEHTRLYETARRATQARDDVLGIVAHDVRSPLNSIGFAAEALERQLVESGETRGQKWVQMISRGIERASRLIQDLLDVTCIEAGALSIARRAVTADRVARDALALLEVPASGASVELQLDLDPELPEIWADDDRLLQVFENLIGNAIKFTPAGGRVTIGARSRAGEVLFSVADTGAGIPAESLPHVFDRFWQAKRTERRGAGLGLPICKGLVEAHGGRIWVESTPGRGSTFFFTIPIVPHLETHSRLLGTASEGGRSA
jgi:PAS domain S-box-containing protein